MNLRAWLLTRCDGEASLAAALDSGADVAILDLGEGARRVQGWLAGRPAPARRLALKIGAAIDDELDAIMPMAPWAIWAACRSGAEVQRLGAKLAVREARLGLVDGATRIVACVGDPVGLLNLSSFAGASPRLAALAWDSRALRARLHAPIATLAPSLARGLIVLAAAAADVAAIDGLSEPGAVRAETESAVREGFSGKIAASPEEVAVIKAVFAGRD